MKITGMFAAAAAVVLLAGCAEAIDNSAVIAGIVPAPNAVAVGEGAFGVKGASFNLTGVQDERASAMLKDFASQLSKRQYYNLLRHHK